MSWRGFEALGEPLYAALVLLDLAILRSEAGEVASVVDIASSICRFFEPLKLYDETVASLLLLHQAIDRSEVTKDILRSVRSSLWRDPLVALQ